MANRPDEVTLQINVAPRDWRLVRLVLPHQLRQIGPQCSAVLISLDTVPPERRYAASGPEDAVQMQRVLEECKSLHTDMRVIEVSSTPDERQRVGRYFGCDGPAPLRDAYGGPYHAYLHGLASADTDIVLHLDADMLIGGRSDGWIAEAVAVMRREPQLLFCAPLPGPPTHDGELPVEVREAHARSQPFGSLPERSQVGPGYWFRHVSTRTFCVSRRRLGEMGVPTVRMRTGWLDRAVRELPAPLEVAMSSAMASAGYRRLDMAGPAPGLWVLHPAARTERFYAGLPEIIARVEAGDVPSQQRGRFELDRSLFDWGPDASSLDPRPLWRKATSRALRRTPLRHSLERRARRFG